MTGWWLLGRKGFCSFKKGLSAHSHPVRPPYLSQLVDPHAIMTLAIFSFTADFTCREAEFPCFARTAGKCDGRADARPSRRTNGSAVFGDANDAGPTCLIGVDIPLVLLDARP